MTSTPNQTEQHFGKSYGGSGPQNYEKYFVPMIGKPVASDLVDAAGLRPGESVLDIACGTGIVSRLAAERVGADGNVVGVDLNPGMLAVAAAMAPSVEWHEASADSIPLADATFDAVLCSLGSQFFPDRAAALGEMHRVLVRGGRIAINATGPTPATFVVLADALAEHINAGLAGFVHQVFSLHNSDEIARLVTNAGFGEVDVSSVTKSLPGPAPDEFLWQYIYSTPLAAAFAETDDDTRAALERDVVAKWQPFVRDGRIVQDVDIHTATGRK